MSCADIQRRVVALGDLQLTNGQTLPDIHLAFETFGTLNAAGDNAVLVLHALTGDAHVTGSEWSTTTHSLHGATPQYSPTTTEAYPSSDPGWWSEVIGPGLAIDTDQYFVVAPNSLGGCYGSTGPASLAPDGRIWGSRFPHLSTTDQVVAEHRLAEALGIGRWSLVIGASLGGQRALEWGVAYPDQVERLVVIASGAHTTAEQAAWIHMQVQAITSDPAWEGGDYSRGFPSDSGETDPHAQQEEAGESSVQTQRPAPLSAGPVTGLALARQIAHITYRCPNELEDRFGQRPQLGEDPTRGGRFAVQSYLDHAGDKLVARFDAGSYVTLSRTMLTFDLGTGRGGVTQALAGIRARTLAIAVDSDRLFFPAQSIQIASGVLDGHYRELHSAHGHDGFLIESDQLNRILTAFLHQQLPARATL